MTESKFMNNAYVAGEVRNVELADVGKGDNARKNSKCNINIHSNGSFVNVKLNTPRKADTNYAEKLYDSLAKGDKITVNGSLEEFFWNDEYRRNINPYCSTKAGYGDNIKILGNDQDLDEKATCRIAGDVFEKEEKYDDDSNLILEFGILYWNTWNPQGNNDLTRKEVLEKAMQNYSSYMSSNCRDFDKCKLKELITDLEDIDKDDLEGIVAIYKLFTDTFNPMLFNIDEYHITALDEFAEEMKEVELYDNITTGVRVNNQTVIDDFGFAKGSVNRLEVGRFVGINENLGSGGTDSALDLDEEW